MPDEPTKQADADDGVQRRCLDPQYQDMRISLDKNLWKITGYAAVFNVETELWPGFREKIAPGAFTESLKKDDVRALFNHDPNVILARNTSGTLRLWEDEKGLGYEILANPDDPDAQRVVPKIKRGDVSQSSFGFNIIKRSVEVNERKDEMTRTIEKAQLFDVSPVTFPAYPSTEAHVRMATNDKNELQYFVGDKVIEAVPLQERETSQASEEEFLNSVGEFLKHSEP